MTADDLPPKPEPVIEPGEPNPGGVDAIDGGDHEGAPTIPDLSPEANPAAAAEPVEMRDLEDTTTEATKSDDSNRDGQDPEEESPA